MKKCFSDAAVFSYSDGRYWGRDRRMGISILGDMGQDSIFHAPKTLSIVKFSSAFCLLYNRACLVPVRAAYRSCAIMFSLQLATIFSLPSSNFQPPVAEQFLPNGLLQLPVNCAFLKTLKSNPICRSCPGSVNLQWQQCADYQHNLCYCYQLLSF